ncbi:hypothetical protein E2C01_008249 [Portunus trituberculatus]|uniref:Uncharacterized protein n=1 Tax=Portunus trituberculatus TaxID=210409 RepID=A0A5B7D1U9_PORTR|nr:hypothetical protein [Portunus trituberculatus]
MVPTEVRTEYAGSTGLSDLGSVSESSISCSWKKSASFFSLSRSLKFSGNTIQNVPEEDSVTVYEEFAFGVPQHRSLGLAAEHLTEEALGDALQGGEGRGVEYAPHVQLHDGGEHLHDGVHVLSSLLLRERLSAVGRSGGGGTVRGSAVGGHGCEKSVAAYPGCGKAPA